MRTGVLNNISLGIGNTPLVVLGCAQAQGVRVVGKLESANPGSSVKDRIAKAMIDAGERDGLITADTVIVEPTSGNTGIGLAMICAERGYRLILTMPESMSQERRKLLARFGAEVSLTPPELGMTGAVDRAKEIVDRQRNAFMPGQFENPANPNIHYATTGPEIWDGTHGSCDVFVAGVGTGGTVSGVGRFLKEKNSGIHVVAVEPTGSPVLSGGRPGPHRIQGIGAGFVPANFDRSVVNEVVTVSNEEAFDMSARLAKEDGILAGISAGANVAGARKVALGLVSRDGFEESRRAGIELTVVTIICDTGERYLSVW